MAEVETISRRIEPYRRILATAIFFVGFIVACMSYFAKENELTETKKELKVFECVTNLDQIRMTQSVSYQAFSEQADTLNKKANDEREEVDYLNEEIQADQLNPNISADEKSRKIQRRDRYKQKYDEDSAAYTLATSDTRKTNDLMTSIGIMLSTNQCDNADDAQNKVHEALDQLQLKIAK